MMTKDNLTIPKIQRDWFCYTIMSMWKTQVIKHAMQKVLGTNAQTATTLCTMVDLT